MATEQTSNHEVYGSSNMTKTGEMDATDFAKEDFAVDLDYPNISLR